MEELELQFIIYFKMKLYPDKSYDEIEKLALQEFKECRGEEGLLSH